MASKSDLDRGNAVRTPGTHRPALKRIELLLEQLGLLSNRRWFAGKEILRREEEERQKNVQYIAGLYKFFFVRTFVAQ